MVCLFSVFHAGERQHIHSIAAYPATLGTGSSPVSMSSSVPSRSALTRRMCSSARIWSSAHHVQSCPSTPNSIPQHRRSNGCVTTVTRAPHWPASALCATARNAPPTDTAGGSQTDKQKTAPLLSPCRRVGRGVFLRISGIILRNPENRCGCGASAPHPGRISMGVGSCQPWGYSLLPSCEHVSSRRKLFH